MEPHPSPIRVLIVDDYPDVAETLGLLISAASSFPVEVVLAFDGAQAVEAAQCGNFDCIILDFDMPPGINGAQAALKIRGILGSKTPALIAMTGKPGHWNEPGVREVFDHFLPKPPDIDSLIGRIAKLRLRC